MNLKSIKIDWPDRWREISRSITANQLNIRVYHISPLAKVDRKIFQDQPISSGPKTSESRIAVPTPSGVGGPAGDFFKFTKDFIASGYAPSYMTPAWADDLQKKMTQTSGVEIPGESDIATDVIIAHFDTKEAAKSRLESFGAGPLGIFNAPLPGTKMSYTDLMSNDVLKSVASKEQLAAMKDMAAKIKQAMPQMQADLKKTGLKYKKMKYLGYEAIFSEMPNPNPAPKAPPVKKKTGGMGGGYGNNMFTPLPKITRPYQKTVSSCQAILVNNFVVSGGLLSLPAFMPAGDTPCYSLSKTEIKTDTVEGIRSTYHVPKASNYASEGYFNKEATEEVIKKILVRLASL